MAGPRYVTASAGSGTLGSYSVIGFGPARGGSLVVTRGMGSAGFGIEPKYSIHPALQLRRLDA